MTTVDINSRDELESLLNGLKDLSKDNIDSNIIYKTECNNFSIIDNNTIRLYINDNEVDLEINDSAVKYWYDIDGKECTGTSVDFIIYCILNNIN